MCLGWRRLARLAEPADAAVHRMLNRWRFVISSDGELWIQPAGPTLEPADVSELMQRLGRGRRRARFARIVFDFSRIETVGRPWTLVFAMLIAVARRCCDCCSLTGLRGQPATVARLYARNAELSALVRSTPDPTQRYAATFAAAPCRATGG